MYNSTSFLEIIPGDEVIEWNGQSLYGRGAQEVHDIIADSKHDLQVELIVSRVIAANRQAAQDSWRQSHSPTRLHHAGTLNGHNVHSLFD